MTERREEDVNKLRSRPAAVVLRFRGCYSNCTLAWTQLLASGEYGELEEEETKRESEGQSESMAKRSTSKWRSQEGINGERQDGNCSDDVFARVAAFWAMGAVRRGSGIYHSARYCETHYLLRWFWKLCLGAINWLRDPGRCLFQVGQWRFYTRSVHYRFPLTAFQPKRPLHHDRTWRIFSVTSRLSTENSAVQC